MPPAPTVSVSLPVAPEMPMPVTTSTAAGCRHSKPYHERSVPAVKRVVVLTASNTAVSDAPGATPPTHDGPSSTFTVTSFAFVMTAPDATP